MAPATQCEKRRDPIEESTARALVQPTPPRGAAFFAAEMQRCTRVPDAVWHLPPQSNSLQTKNGSAAAGYRTPLFSEL